MVSPICDSRVSRQRCALHCHIGRDEDPACSEKLAFTFWLAERRISCCVTLSKPVTKWRLVVSWIENRKNELARTIALCRQCLAGIDIRDRYVRIRNDRSHVSLTVP